MNTDPLDVFTPKLGRNPRLKRLRYYRRDYARLCSCWMCQYNHNQFKDYKYKNPTRGSRDYYLVYSQEEIHDVEA